MLYTINSSEEAAKYYYENRYSTFDGCGDPCKAMEVTTNLKFRNMRNETTGYVKLYFPKKIVVNNEIKTISFTTVGNQILLFCHPIIGNRPELTEI